MPKQRDRIGTMKQKLPRLLFNPEELIFLKKALAPLEQMIFAQKQPLPNLKLALATVREVQAKISRMIQCSACGEDVELDFNEVLILQTSVWIFAAALEFTDPSPESEQLKQQCQKLSLLLAAPLK